MKKSIAQWKTVRQSIDVLPERARKRIVIAALIQVVLNFLDLAGLALIAGIGSISLHALRGTSSGPTVEMILRLAHMENLTVAQKVSLLACLSIFLFATKTIMSIILMRKIYRFLNHIGANLSVDISSRIIS
jgi:hypothetical protein